VVYLVLGLRVETWTMPIEKGCETDFFLDSIIISLEAYMDRKGIA
jgi:hypothetical protein